MTGVRTRVISNSRPLSPIHFRRDPGLTNQSTGNHRPAAGAKIFGGSLCSPPQAPKFLDVHLPPVHFAAKIDSKRDVSDISTHVPCLPFIAGAQQGVWWGLMSKNFPKNFSLRHEKFQKSRNRFLGWAGLVSVQIRPQRPKRRILTSRTTIGPHFYVSFPIRPFAFVGQAGIAPSCPQFLGK